MNILTHSKISMVVSALLAVAVAAPVYATNKTEFPVENQVGMPRVVSGAAERLELANSLRVFSRDIPAAACHLFNGVAADASLYRLEKAKKYFLGYLGALEHGDLAFNISDPEQRHSALQIIGAIKEEWVSIDESIYRLVHVPQDHEAMSTLRTKEEALFTLTSQLMSELQAEHSNPAEMTFLEAMLMDISGRQVALIQQISNASCDVWAGDRSEDRLNALSSSVALFERGIRALQGGLPELGIVSAPTRQIKVGLAGLGADWSEVREMIARVSAGESNKDEMAALYARLNQASLEMEQIVGLYAAYSKRLY